MRHGEAVPHFQNDSTRELTSKGVQECQASANWIKKILGPDESIKVALVSPFTRAQQSLAIVSDVNVIESTEETADLVPSGSAELMADYVQFQLLAQQQQPIFIASHMPFVSYLVDALCGQQHSILFPTAAIAMLEYDVKAASCSLIEMFHPKLYE